MRVETKSLCPECLSVIPAEVYEECGRILIRKRCEEHGEFEDIYWADAELYKRFSAFESVGKGFATRAAERGCPYDCGLCPAHKTTTLLANIDVTNRCNQRCPTCFANAAASGRLYEPSQDEIWKMLEVLRSEVPPCPAVQFAGGEPTVRSDFVELVKMAKKLGFAQIQVATNGIMLAKSVEFCERLVHAGLHTVYLQFDGVKEEAYEKLRGRRVLKTKLKAVENCRAGGIRSVVLVPTLARGVNDDQIGDIIRYAVENLDVVRGVNVQPVSFTGRIDKSELRKLRITIPDFIKLVEEQTDGQIPKESFYPVPAVVPVSRFVEAWKGEPQVAFTVHPHCGAATYVFVDGKRLIPITDFVDVEGILEFLKEKAEELERARLPALAKLKVAISAAKQINKFIDAEKAPSGAESMRKVIDVLTRGDRESTAEFHRRTLFIGCMHFMDPYNFDIKRVQRCGIHYVTPDLRIIPFCTYNTLHRPEVEAKFSRTL